MIRSAAESAASMAADQEAAARQAERDQLVAAARLKVEQLPTPDAKFPLAGKGKDLTVAHVDMDARLVVLSDGDVALSVRPDQAGEIRVVELVDDGWTARSEPITTLAELGDALPDGPA